MFNKLLIWANQMWVIGRRSDTAYLRFFPNPGFMIPWPGGKRLRWSVFYGLKITNPPTLGNPRGL
jgi:hypothetical protein